jgi:hypothetical protein
VECERKNDVLNVNVDMQMFYIVYNMCIEINVHSIRRIYVMEISMLVWYGKYNYSIHNLYI